jgi:membrane protease YdiL (CAAX protease family)
MLFSAGVAILGVYNVARGLGVFGAFEDASALVLLGAFVALALLAKLSASDLGMARADVRRGTLYGTAALLGIIVVLVLIAATPGTSGFLDDRRADVSGARLLFDLVVSILLLTVIPEEFAFRGVMLALGRRMWSARGATIVTSVLFGLWHISPTLGTMSENREFDDATRSPGGTALLVMGSVLATFAAGMVFGWLRVRSRSLIAPVIAHFGTNGVALIVAWFVVH